VLEAEYFDAGKVIIIEGTPGDKFYFLEEVSSYTHHPQPLEKFPNVFGVHLASMSISLLEKGRRDLALLLKSGKDLIGRFLHLHLKLFEV
jgi:hypothetical protein